MSADLRPTTVAQASESDVTSKRLLRNTVANGFGYIGNGLITLAITPFLLHRLGVEQYGLWVLALSLTFSTGYLALADLGLAEASVKFVAEARAAGASETINAIVSSTLAVFAAIGMLAGGLIAAAVPLLVRLFGVDDHLVHTAQIAFLLMGFEVVLELPVAALRSVIAGVQSYAWLRTIDLGSKVLWAVVAVAVVRQGHGVVALAGLTLAATSVRALATLVVAHRLQPGLQIRRRHVDRRTIKMTMGYGSFVGGLQLLSVIYSQMDRVIIAVVISVAAVSRYEVAFRIQSLAVLALTVGSSAVLPAAAYNAVRADTEKQRQLYIRGSRYSVAISLSVTIGALMYARWIIEAWVGADYTNATNASRLFLVFPILACVNQVGVTMLIGLGRAKRVLVYQTIAVLTNLVASVLLAPHFGISGVVIGTLLGGLVTWIPYLL